MQRDTRTVSGTVGLAETLAKVEREPVMLAGGDALPYALRRADPLCRTYGCAVRCRRRGHVRANVVASARSVRRSLCGKSWHSVHHTDLPYSLAALHPRCACYVASKGLTERLLAMPAAEPAAIPAPPGRRRLRAGRRAPHKSQILRPESGSMWQRPPGFSTLESQMPNAQAAQAARGFPPCVAQYSRRASQFSHLGIAGMTAADRAATRPPLR